MRTCVAVALLVWTALAGAVPVLPSRADMVISEVGTPPPEDAPWQQVQLPDNWARTHPGLRGATSWYRLVFERPGGAAHGASWAVYLPYFYDGATIFLNGEPLAVIPASDEHRRVLWVRPHLLPIPDTLLRSGENVLTVRATLHAPWVTLRFPAVHFGPVDRLLPLYERRLFWMRTMPQVTCVTSGLMAVFMLFIWWRRRQETLYGLLGVASLLWGVRTLSFVMEQMPVEQWMLWRLAYWTSTGGFVVALSLFAMRFAGVRRRWLDRGLGTYWLIGPLVLAAGGARAEPWVSRVWAAGLVPIGLLILGLLIHAAWRQRTWQASLLLSALLLSLAAGLHDYLVVTNTDIAARLAPVWSGHRIYLLHLAANVLLLVMAAILAARFIGSLDEVEQLNLTLESRVADRERQLAEHFESIAQLERDRATENERQRIMLDMHDGLGSQLFTSLARVERGALQPADVAEMLRSCIAEMRLVLDALAPPELDLRSALGNFRYRWDAQLAAAGVHTTWSMDASDEQLQIPRGQRLQILRVLQEALTNVVKHSRARHLEVTVTHSDGGLRIEVRDDGRGIDDPPSVAGRGMSNMVTRARQIGAQLTVERSSPGTRVVLQLGPEPGDPGPRPSRKLTGSCAPGA